MTTPLRGALAFYDVASILVTGIAEELADTDAGPVGRACVVPGVAAHDDCCAGQVTVSPTRFFLSDDFPASVGPSARTSTCDPSWIVGELVIQVIRCAPTPTGPEGVPCDALALAARTTLVDAAVTLATVVAVLCGLKRDDRVVEYVLAEQTTVGPDGGCVGSELRVLVAVDR